MRRVITTIGNRRFIQYKDQITCFKPNLENEYRRQLFHWYLLCCAGDAGRIRLVRLTQWLGELLLLSLKNYSPDFEPFQGSWFFRLYITRRGHPDIKRAFIWKHSQGEMFRLPSTIYSTLSGLVVCLGRHHGLHPRLFILNPFRVRNGYSHLRWCRMRLILEFPTVLSQWKRSVKWMPLRWW